MLLRALRSLPSEEDDLTGRLALRRLKLIRTVLAVAGRAYTAQYAARREIAAARREAYPDELDEPSAAALVRALTGMLAGALDVLLARGDTPLGPEVVRSALLDAVARALGAQSRPDGVQAVADARGE